MSRIVPLALSPDGTVLGIPLALANRHGLVTGATGTGKTVTLQKLAEGFSAAGVPVFAADIKGDLSGLAKAGSSLDRFAARATQMGVRREPRGFPVRFWDLYAEDGLPFGTSVEELGPLFMARLLELNQVQEGALNVLLERERVNGDNIRDLEDLKAMVSSGFDFLEELKSEFGHVAVATLGAIQRQILVLNAQNGWRMFREPALDIADLMAVDGNGRGVINLLSADRLTGAPRLYSTFLLFLLTKLFNELPEVGDLPKPRLVFFFDEAHLLFATATPKLLEAIERLVRLIRSKGVGVYFVTQSPRDVPESVLAQLGHRVQHALRAFTPRDQKMIRAVAQTFRPNPAIKVAEVVTTLAVGECLISTLSPDGIPSIVEHARVLPPSAQVGPITDDERKGVLGRDMGLFKKYAFDMERQDAFRSFLARVNPRKLARINADEEKLAKAQTVAEHIAQVEGEFAAELVEIGKLGFFARRIRKSDWQERKNHWQRLLADMNTTG